MPKLPRISAVELVRALRRAGFVEKHQKGSHLTLVHPRTRRRVLIPMHTGDLRTNTLANILRQAGWTAEDLRRLLR